MFWLRKLNAQLGKLRDIVDQTTLRVVGGGVDEALIQRPRIELVLHTSLGVINRTVLISEHLGLRIGPAGGTPVGFGQFERLWAWGIDQCCDRILKGAGSRSALCPQGLGPLGVGAEHRLSFVRNHSRQRHILGHTGQPPQNHASPHSTVFLISSFERHAFIFIHTHDGDL